MTNYLKNSSKFLILQNCIKLEISYTKKLSKMVYNPQLDTFMTLDNTLIPMEKLMKKKLIPKIEKTTQKIKKKKGRKKWTKTHQKILVAAVKLFKDKP